MRPGERLVTLADGRQVSSYSEDWRHECEARAVLALPTLSRRRAYLYGEQASERVNGKWIMKTVSRGILQKRGQAEVERLEGTMLALWKQGKQEKQSA